MRWLTRRFPGPPLDGNPVLWREWHRNRPSGWSRRVWGLYAIACVPFSVIAVAHDVGPNVTPGPGCTSLWVNGFHIAVGILLLSAGASTSLAEERARGSLDVLLCTPLSTRSIIMGKWLGTFRRVPWLVALPTFVGTCLALYSGRWAGLLLLTAEIMSYGAFFTSLGLALATWMPRLGRAAATCVTVDVLVTAGWFFLVLMYSNGPESERRLGISPFGGPAILTAEIAGIGPTRYGNHQFVLNLGEFVYAYRWDYFAIVLYVCAAAGLLLATLLTFDRCLGRATSRKRSDEE